MLPKEFFNRSSVIVAKDLLGKFLCRKLNGKVEKFKIVETEAYEGFTDKASHASRGKTLRNSPMFEEAGTIYVYFTYGMHYMLNIVCGDKGHPSAVLIRGIEGVVGPGRLTKYLNVDKTLNNQKLGKKVGLWIESLPTQISHGRNKSVYAEKTKILKTPRIGVDYSGPIWSKKLWRFVLVEK
jgi:DNA-3-methyladenine glycosylase